jgi:hypothetical protein
MPLHRQARLRSFGKGVGIVSITQCEQQRGREALLSRAEFCIECAGVEVLAESR